MLYAIKDGERQLAEPQSRAICPDCSGVMLAKCGQIVIWHWAHESLADCDGWAEGESQWHLEWKSLFPADCVEVRMPPHRADIAINGKIIELQHSSISVEAITERESFYGKGLLWLFDASGWIDNVSFRQPPGKPYHSFRWRWLHKRQRFLKQPLFWDLGDGRIFDVRKLWSDGSNGWGFMLTKDQFLARFLGTQDPNKANETELPIPVFSPGGRCLQCDLVLADDNPGPLCYWHTKAEVLT